MSQTDFRPVSENQLEKGATASDRRGPTDPRKGELFVDMLLNFIDCSCVPTGEQVVYGSGPYFAGRQPSLYKLEQTVRE